MAVHSVGAFVEGQPEIVAAKEWVDGLNSLLSRVYQNWVVGVV